VHLHELTPQLLEQLDGLEKPRNFESRAGDVVKRRTPLAP
jgi:hypothetical protein